MKRLLVLLVLALGLGVLILVGLGMNGEEYVYSEGGSTGSSEDRDGDGLLDDYEVLYGTNPQKADTDGDGISDYEEVLGRQDPLTPEGGQESLLESWQAEQYDEGNMTQKYLDSLPDDIADEDVLDKARIEVWVAENRGELLPKVEVKSSEDIDVAKYLDDLSSDTNPELVPVTNDDINLAFTAWFTQDGEVFERLIGQQGKNLSVLESLVAPAEHLELHTEIVAANQALYDNLITLSRMDDDFVAGIVASQNIRDLAVVFNSLKLRANELRK